jgi:hypothetical protein
MDSNRGQTITATEAGGEAPAVPAVHLAEYEALKDEQRARIVARDGLLRVTLTAIGAVLFAMYQTANPDVLLAIPGLALVLGWLYVDNDRKIVAIRVYIRDQLAPAVDPGRRAFRWEASPRRSPGSRRLGNLAVMVGLFVVPAGSACAAWSAQSLAGALADPSRYGMAGVSLVGWLATASTLALIVAGNTRRGTIGS